jgi:hypothetical protein
MISKIDWVSFVLKLDQTVEGGGRELARDMMIVAKTAFPDDLQDALFDQPFEPVKGRAPYSMCMRRSDHNVSIYFGGKQAHILFEVTGGGCEALSRHSQLLPLVELVRPFISRLDVAVDMPVSTLPHTFTASGYSDRFKSTSNMVSDTGETVYIGSRDSERYARVYRYNPPHPRSAWLRCEFCLKHENAKAAAALLPEIGLLELVARLGNTFGWRHPAWQPDKATESLLSGWTPERRHGATVRWLLTSVFPAMAKLVKDGTIENLDDFLQTNLYKLIDD